MTVTASYDTGWNKLLQCGGHGGWTDQVALNEQDAALFQISNGHSRLSICGMKWIRGMTFSVLSLSNTIQGFEIVENDNAVTIVCKGPYTVEYDSANLAPKEYRLE